MWFIEFFYEKYVGLRETSYPFIDNLAAIEVERVCVYDKLGIGSRRPSTFSASYNTLWIKISMYFQYLYPFQIC